MATKINGNAWAADIDDGKSVLIGIGNDTYIFDRRAELADFVAALASHVIKDEQPQVAEPKPSKSRSAKKEADHA